MTTGHHETTMNFQRALDAQEEDPWPDLTLVVSGVSALSIRAISNVKRLCEDQLAGHYHLTIVDLLDDSSGPRNANFLAAPTLLINKPLPVRRFVGDLSHTDGVMSALGLPGSDSTAGIA